jgi:hypothetical protein
MHTSYHVNEVVIGIKKAEHTFLAAAHSVYGAIKVARAVRTDAIEVGRIG